MVGLGLGLEKPTRTQHAIYMKEIRLVPYEEGMEADVPSILGIGLSLGVEGYAGSVRRLIIV